MSEEAVNKLISILDAASGPVSEVWRQAVEWQAMKGMIFVVFSAAL